MPLPRFRQTKENLPLVLTPVNTININHHGGISRHGQKGSIVKPALPTFTEEEINDVMKEGDVLYEFSDHEHSFKKEDYPLTVRGWKIHIVSEGPKGRRMIATPFSPNARRIYTEGKIKRMSQDFPDVDNAIIMRYIDCARRVRYAMEENVIAWSLRALKTITEDDYKAIRSADNSFHEASKRGYRASMSWPRFDAALSTVAKVLRIES